MLTEELILKAYSMGYFPMADSKESSEINWYCPEKRAVFFPHAFHLSKSLGKIIKKGSYELKINKDFSSVIANCRSLRAQSWINDEIINVYTRLHYKGFVHSFEVYYDSVLAGGLYGVQIGGIFFGESLFHLQSNASKIALYELIRTMRDKSMLMLDCQYKNSFLKQFNLQEISFEAYQKIMAEGLLMDVSID